VSFEVLDRSLTVQDALKVRLVTGAIVVVTQREILILLYLARCFAIFTGHFSFLVLDHERLRREWPLIDLNKVDHFIVLNRINIRGDFFWP
jgi:hypothetical protein